jgi:hypothetical protein
MALLKGRLWRYVPKRTQSAKKSAIIRNLDLETQLLSIDIGIRKTYNNQR